MQSLARFDDVHTSLQKATQSLRSESNLTYPSAHLVPSLFRHSNAILFRLQPVGWRSQLKYFLPRDRWQSAALALMTALSLFFSGDRAVNGPSPVGASPLPRYCAAAAA